jgi:RHS repeat-associated protein
MILRDRSTQNNGTLDERLWVQQDANWNMTALVNGSGSIVERYVYDPYGKVTFLNVNWGTLSGSAYAWIYLFQGGRNDTTSSPYCFRNRDLSPMLTRWMEPDQLTFAGFDADFYRFEADVPTSLLDPTGLSSYGVGIGISMGIADAIFPPLTLQFQYTLWKYPQFATGYRAGYNFGIDIWYPPIDEDGGTPSEPKP